MTYAKRNDVTLDGWTVVELDTGELVAVRCDKKRITRTDEQGNAEQAISYLVQAKVVDGAGVPVSDPAGKPVATAFTHSATLAIVESLGDGNITRDLLLAALGEPTQGAVTLSDRNKASASIREAIAAAGLVGQADAGAVL